jgi:hypothetical protein
MLTCASVHVDGIVHLLNAGIRELPESGLQCYAAPG